MPDDPVAFPTLDAADMDLGASIGAAGAGQDGHPLGRIQRTRRRFELGVARPNNGQAGPDRRYRRGPLHLVQQDIARGDQHGNVFPLERRADGNIQRIRQLRRRGHDLAVRAAFTKQLLWVGLPEVVGADLLSGDMRSHCHDWHARAVRVVEPIDQVQVAWSAARRTHRELTRNCGLTGSGKRSRFLVADVLPGDASLAIQRVSEAVERVAGYALHAANTRALERLDDQV